MATLEIPDRVNVFSDCARITEGLLDLAPLWIHLAQKIAVSYSTAFSCLSACVRLGWLFPFVLIAGTDQHALTIVLRDSSSGAGVPNAVGLLISTDRVLEARSGDEGVLQFAPISKGSYDLKVSAQGFNDLIQRGINYSGEESVVEVTLSLKSFSCGYPDRVEYRPPSGERLASVSGRVVDVDRLKGVRGVEVTLIRLDPPRDKITARSDNQGNFSAPHVDPGRYRLCASKAGYDSTAMDYFVIPRENGTF